MLYSEFEEMCRKAWSEKINFIFIDLTRFRNEGKYSFFKESKNT